MEENILNIGSGLYVKEYKISSKNIKKNNEFSFVFISDLHGKEYGKNNSKLINMIDKKNVEYILIGGDMIVARKPKETIVKALNLIKILSKKYKIIYSLGNHEEKIGGRLLSYYIKKLKKLNVVVLDNSKYTIKELGISIYGLRLSLNYYRKFSRKTLSLNKIYNLLGEKTDFSILLAHSPKYFEAYNNWGADLTLSGHLHGGIARIPFVGGVIGPDLFLFPKYSGGIYTENGKKMIVSCGAGEHTIPIRIFNPPEITFVRLVGGA